MLYNNQCLKVTYGMYTFKLHMMLCISIAGFGNISSSTGNAERHCRKGVMHHY